MKPTWTSSARTGPARTYRQLRFFACEGLIVLHDERHPEEDYNVILPDDFAERAKELARTGAKCMASSNVSSLRAEGRAYIRGANLMDETIKEAKFMGDPSDPAVRAFWAKHQNRKSVVSLRAGNDKAGYPDLPELPRGKDTGRTVAVDGQAAMVNNARTIHQPPRRKRKLILDL